MVLPFSWNTLDVRPSKGCVFLIALGKGLFGDLNGRIPHNWLIAEHPVENVLTAGYVLSSSVVLGSSEAFETGGFTVQYLHFNDRGNLFLSIRAIDMSGDNEVRAATCDSEMNKRKTNFFK